VNDLHSSENYYLDCNTGESYKIDLSGMNVKTYHTNITGVVGPATRTRYGKLLNDNAMIPEIDKKVKLW
jgi:hypothetical protein